MPQKLIPAVTHGGSALARDLAQAIEGEVRFDAGSRSLYATDASNYRQVPIGVVLPRTTQEVIKTVELCRHHGGRRVLSRGCGHELVRPILQCRRRHRFLQLPEPLGVPGRVQRSLRWRRAGQAPLVPSVPALRVPGAGRLSFALPQLKRPAIVHAHCRHKSVLKTDAYGQVPRNLGLDYEILDSGCCGMAGSFGFDAHKYEVSMRCAERVLLPAVRAADANTLIVADGFSCREQIRQTTGRKALHLAEVLKLAVDNRQ